MDLIIGLPTYCEAASIAEITARIDANAQRLPMASSTLIANCDNCSPDGTSEIFAQVSTKLDKVALRTAPGIRGKGANLRRLFEFTIEHNAKHLICLDADLEVLPADWLAAYVSALDAKADLIVPLYRRFWYDANLTNQVAVPLIATTGEPIRQPIGGDFGFSLAAIETYLGLNWPEGADGYGIDSFLVLRALRHGLVLHQQPLSTGKIHSWRSDSAGEVFTEMEEKFWQVVSTLLGEIEGFPSTTPRGGTIRFPESPPLGADSKPYDPSHLIEAGEACWERRWQVAEHLEALGCNVQEAKPVLDNDCWAAILCRLLTLWNSESLRRSLVKAFETLFYIRLAHVLPTLRNQDVEPMVERLANTVVARRYQTESKVR